ncbi:MAG: hypothetical protein QOJ59_344 [Thermomicrobiales bacterium]|nr:hypothetical protein [Thermomicrobiales bacterium]
MRSQLTGSMNAHFSDFRRRRSALVFLLSLPFAFYLVRLPDDHPQVAFVTGGMGLAWSVACAALFSVLSARRADHVLILAGFRPLSLVLGRFLFVAILGVVLAASLWRLMIWQEEESSRVALAVGLGLAVLVAIPIGLAVSLIFADELDGTLLIIGIIGIELSLPDNSAVGRYLPLHGPVELLGIAAGKDGEMEPAVVAGLLYAVALFVVGYTWWHGRVQPRPRFRIPQSSALPATSRSLTPWHWPAGFAIRIFVAAVAVIALLENVTRFGVGDILPPESKTELLSVGAYKRASLSKEVRSGQLLCLTTGFMRLSGPGQTLELARPSNRGAAVCWIGLQDAHAEDLSGPSMLRRFTVSGDAEAAALALLRQSGRAMTKEPGAGCKDKPCSYVDLVIVRSDGTFDQPSPVKSPP